MANEYDYVLYDSMNFGATANAENILFQVIQNGDSTHTETYTNNRAAGQIPQGEKFVVSEVGLIIDKLVAKADLANMFNTSIFEIRIQNLTVFKVPGQLVVAASAYGGAPLEATIADTPTVGLEGDGYQLTKPLTLDGGVPFQVRVLQGVAVTASSLVKAYLKGILTMSSGY